MFFKIILGLALFIVIAALGANSGLGEGFFGFKAKGKAADLVEFTRDISTVMQTYKADHPSNISVTTIVDEEMTGRSGAAVVDNSTVAGDGVVVFSDVVNELASIDLIKGDGSYEIGGFAAAVFGAAGNEDVVLVNSSPELTNEICDKVNEVLGVTGDIGGDLTGVVNTELNTAEVTAAMVTTIQTASGLTIADGGVEGVCVKDTSGTAQNAFVFYVQKS